MPNLPYPDQQLGGGDSQALAYTRLVYPNPFLDLSRFFMPKTIKSLFKLCRIFYYRNEFVNNVITKLAEYPITDLVLEGIDDEQTKEKYGELINHHIQIKRLLIEIGLDYFTYGNCFVSANMKFRRFLVCPKCTAVESVERVKYAWKNFSFVGDCKACGSASVTFRVEDKYLKHPKYFKFIRWGPENITIEHDELTGENKYYYEMQAAVKKGIVEGKRDVVERTPMLFIEAVKNNRKIVLDANNLYHFKRATLAEEDKGWGKPLILAALPMLWYMQTLRRGNEAIAADHLIPMRSLFPSSQGNIDPFTQMNLGAWRNAVEDNLYRWRRDPNHIAVFPIPIGYQALGGDAKALNVTPELKFLEELVINSFGVPTEFIKGGATWTSSSVSLRIIENHFLTYREELHDFLNYFAAPKIAGFLDFPPAKMKLKKFRMSDDIQAKEALLQLAQLNKISDSYLQEEFGLDPKMQRAYATLDNKHNIDIQTEQLTAQAEMMGKQTVITERYRAKAMEAFLEEQARIRERMFVIELKQELQAADQDPSDILQKYTAQIAGMDPMLQQQTIIGLQQTSPLSAGFVVQRLQSMYGGTPEQQAEMAMREKEMGHEKDMAKHEEKSQEKAQAHEDKKMEHEGKKMEHEKEMAPHEERMAKEKAKASTQKKSGDK
ncbi:MAG: hypothetical protein WC666_04195 [Candidatus Paceibacterota bacterium]|jgi:hypothetical protein